MVLYLDGQTDGWDGMGGAAEERAATVATVATVATHVTHRCGDFAILLQTGFYGGRPHLSYDAA